MAGNGPETAKRVEGGRLVYYRSAADSGFWDSHWQNYFSERIYRKAGRGHLEYLKPVIHHLPRTGRILEAGCGMGQYVLALKARGFDAEGVDFGEETIAAVKRMRPDLPVRVGDVTRLDVPDGYYCGYISLGVMEHRREGPEPFLCEAFRILEPGGVALISVPYFHPLRRLKARMGLYPGGDRHLEFYQYAFQEQEFADLLMAAGFEIVDRTTYGSAKGIRDEIPWTRSVLRLRGVHRLVERPLKRYGHMLLMVCRKPVADERMLLRAAG